MKIATDYVDLSFSIFGKGSKNMLAFHGVGQGSSIFEEVSHLHPEFTFYAFDLPFHGKNTLYEPKNYLTPEDVVEIVQKLIDRFDLQKISFLGFSIGAKLIFPLIPVFASKIEHIWLLAPDGIRTNIWYRLGTGSQMTRFLFRQSLKHPNFLKLLGSTLKSVGLLDDLALKFVFKTISTEEKRMRVYSIWVYLRKLKMDIDAVADSINNEKTPLTIILGRKDSIITKNTVQPLLKKVPHATIRILPGGHHKLIGKFADYDLDESS